MFLILVPFEKWGIYYVGEIHPHSSKGMAYIIMATKDLTKGAKAKVVKTNTSANVASLCMIISARNLDALSGSPIFHGSTEIHIRIPYFTLLV